MATLSEAQAQLAAWEAASLALASSKSYSIEVDGSSRTLTRSDAAEVTRMLAYWRAEVARLGRGGSGRSRSRYVVN